jgi:hypothetical protein
MKNKTILTLLALTMSLPVSVGAENATMASGTPPMRDVRRPFVENRKEINETARDNRKEIIDGRKAVGTTTEGEREEFHNSMKENRVERIEALRENRAAASSTIAERKKELIEGRKANKEERKTKLEERKREIVTNALERIFKRLEERVAKLTSADAKIAEKLSSLNVAGKDTGSTTPLYTTAQSALSKAKTDVAAAKAASLEATNATTTKETLRSFTKVAEDSTRAAGEAYRAVLKSIRALSPEEENSN